MTCPNQCTKEDFQNKDQNRLQNYLIEMTNKRHFVADVDECQDQMHICHLNAQCNNTVGSFNCTCLQGYSGDGVDCYGTCNYNPSNLSLARDWS